MVCDARMETMGALPKHSSYNKRTPAHDGDLGHQRDKLHQLFRKAESFLVVRFCTKNVGFAAFRFRRVPDAVSPAYQ